jgi:hypothetical protein
MSDTLQLRTAIIGLIGLAAVEEEELLLAAAAGAVAGAAAGAVAEAGGPDCWAAAPIVAHNTEFRRQQVQRLDAIRLGRTPPTFAEIDHRSEDVYRGYCEQPAASVAQTCRQVTATLIDGVAGVSDDDLLDPSRHPWLQGRQLWLQIIVRGFWHPMGHIGDYYLDHAQPDRAVALQSHAVAFASYLTTPAMAAGMARYNLACVQARAELPDAAIETLAAAIALNPALLANIGRDADLAALRDTGRLDPLLASRS